MQDAFDLDQTLRALESDSETDRLYAAEELGMRLLPETAVSMARQLGRENSQIVRDALVYNLKQMDSSAAYDLVFAMFSLPDAYLRNAAVTIFGGDGEDSIAFLGARLDHADKEVRKLILDSMVEIGSPTAVMAIRAGLHDTSANVRITAVEYLGRLADTESIDEMLDLFGRDTEPMLRSTIIEALLSFGDEQTLRRLMRLLMPDDGTVFDPFHLPQLVVLLAGIGASDDLVALCARLPNPALYADEIIGALVEIRRRGADAKSAGTFDILAMLVREPELREDLRMTGLKFLSTFGSDEAREVIRQVGAETGDADVREFCAELLSGGA